MVMRGKSAKVRLFNCEVRSEAARLLRVAEELAVVLGADDADPDLPQRLALLLRNGLRALAKNFSETVL